ncbi:type II CRISPR RNA-guided endonuclease Cas9 [Mycoplasma anserisalpingitidis]|uniref:type II CRISPR RNA-guided endonuclease Cas9 n=1 Tax=Mycoplasma anserisalpingitidis TaxID=519450 RepID=UPI001CF625F2|nr:type II CRISPR RNA-guided endonuclease Cas9 [Mycoplasma anserisalpingitidis]UCU26578.1 type II CRISPR RNA-guided endonuclease Cas9 [Mycoplasma anserisalpingitidis]UCU27415.1 type II CRISPR RNA-guided endonuclease Cas9 [Mycoplasma anserisalpingitidis]
MEQNNNSEITLGLDLGVGSVGWTILKTSEENGQKTNEVLKTGVELFPEVKSAKKRREKRGSRRLIRRRKLKLSKLRTMIMNCCDENNNNLFGYKSKEELENDLSSSGFIKINETQKIYILDVINNELNKLNIGYTPEFINKLGFNSEYSFNNFLLEYKNNIQLLRLLFIYLLMQNNFDIKNNPTKIYLLRKITMKFIYDLFKNRGFFYSVNIDSENNLNEIENFSTFKKFSKDVLNSQAKLKYELNNIKEPDKEVFSNVEWSRELEWILNKIFNDDIFNNFKAQIINLFKFTRDFSKGPGSELSYSPYGIYKLKNDGKHLFKEYENIWDKNIKKCSFYNIVNGYNKNENVEIELSTNYKIFNTITSLQNILNEKGREAINSNTYKNFILKLANIKRTDKNKGIKIEDNKIKLKLSAIKDFLVLSEENNESFIQNLVIDKIKNKLEDEMLLKGIEDLNSVILEESFEFPKFEYIHLLLNNTNLSLKNFDDIISTKEIFDQFTDILRKNSDKEDRNENLKILVNQLIKNGKIQIDTDKKFNELINGISSLKPRYGNLSSKALDGFNNSILIDGKKHSFEAYKNNIIKTSNEFNDKNIGKVNIDLFFRTKNLNATAQKTLKIANNLVEKLYDKYHFNNIIIEVARELNKSDSAKKKMKLENDSLYKLKNLIKRLLLTKNNVQKDLNTLIRKSMLWIEQNGYDLYSSEKIPSPFDDITKLQKYEIDHIIPQSKFYDGRNSNLVLTLREINKEKSDKTAYEYIEKNPNKKIVLKCWNDLFSDENNENFNEFDKILSQCIESDDIKNDHIECMKNYIIISRKKKKNSLFKKSEDQIASFLRSNLTDTQIMTKNALEWFKIKYRNADVNIVPFKGFVTSAIRIHSDLIKDRNDNIHHAIDSTIISTTYNNYKTFKDLINEDNIFKSIKYIKEEQDQVIKAVKTVIKGNINSKDIKYNKEFEDKVNFKYYPVIKFNKKTTEENIVAVYQQYQNNGKKTIRDLRRSNSIKGIDVTTLIDLMIQSYHIWKNKNESDLSLEEIYLNVVSHKKTKKKDKIYLKWLPIWVNDSLKFSPQIGLIYDSLILLLKKCDQHHDVSEECDDLVSQYHECISKHKKLINNSDIENKWFVFIPKKYLMKDTTEFIVIKKLTIFDYSQNRNTSSYINWIQKDENSKIGNLKEIDEIYYGILCIKNKNDNDWKPIILRYDFLKNVSERIELIKILSKIDTHITNDCILKKINNWITKNIEGFKKFNYIKEDEDIQITKETEVIYLLNKLTYIRKEEKSNSDKSVEQIENNNLFIIKKIGYTNIQVKFSSVREKQVHYKPILNTVLKDYKRWIK